MVSSAPDMFAAEKAEAERLAEEEARKAAEEAEANAAIYGDSSGSSDYAYWSAEEGA